MESEREIFLKQNTALKNQAIKTVEDISRERDIKGNANVTTGRYGELVANMVKFAESELALKMIDQELAKRTLPLYYYPSTKTLPAQHEPEKLHVEDVINPT